MIDLALGCIADWPASERCVLPESSYGDRGGRPELRCAIAEQLGIAPAQVIVTAGASLGILSTLAAMRDRGIVICPRPYYPAYPGMARALGLEPFYYSVLSEGQPFAVQWSDIETAVDKAHGSAILLWNFPHNPTGVVETRADQIRLDELLRTSDVVVLRDLAYGSLIFDPPCRATTTSASSVSQIRVYSFSKEFGLAGERIGYLVADEQSLSRIERAHWQFAMTPSAAGQSIALAMLTDPCRHQQFEALLSRLRRRRELAIDLLAGSGVCSVTVPAGGLFLWPCFPGLKVSSGVFAQLLAATGVKVIPAEEFGSDQKRVRISMGASEESLKAGLGKIVEAARRLSS